MKVKRVNGFPIYLLVDLWEYRSSSLEVFLGKGVLKMCTDLQENTHAEVWWSYTSALVFSCKFTIYFQNTFLWETYGGLLPRLPKIHRIKLQLQIQLTFTLPTSIFLSYWIVVPLLLSFTVLIIILGRIPLTPNSKTKIVLSLKLAHWSFQGPL